MNGFQQYALQTRLGIRIIYGVDAIRGHAAVNGAVVFPHSVGLGATRDPDLVERIGRTTAREMAPLGEPTAARLASFACHRLRCAAVPVRLWPVGPGQSNLAAVGLPAAS